MLYLQDDKLIDKYFVIEGKVEHESWFIKMLLNSSSVPKELKYVVFLSTVSKQMLIQMYIDNVLNKKYMNDVIPKLYHILKFKIFSTSARSDDTLLNENMFSVVQDNIIIDLVHRYATTIDTLIKFT